MAQLDTLLGFLQARAANNCQITVVHKQTDLSLIRDKHIEGRWLVKVVNTEREVDDSWAFGTYNTAKYVFATVIQELMKAEEAAVLLVPEKAADSIQHVMKAYAAETPAD